MVFSGATEDDRKEATRLKDHTHLRLSRATLALAWYDGAMVTLLPIEPISKAHGALIVEVFNRFFIDKGGQPDGGGVGNGGGYGYGNGRGDGYGLGWDHGFGDGNGGKIPEAWRAD